MHRFYGDSLAQQVEHIPFKDGVVGSNPTRITKESSLTPSGDSFFISIPIYHSATYISQLFILECFSNFLAKLSWYKLAYFSLK